MKQALSTKYYGQTGIFPIHYDWCRHESICFVRTLFYFNNTKCLKVIFKKVIQNKPHCCPSPHGIQRGGEFENTVVTLLFYCIHVISLLVMCILP